MRREFVERIRNKWFIISTVLGPLLMIAFIAVPIMLAERGGRERRIAVVDATTTGFGERLTAVFTGPIPVRATRVGTPLANMEEVADSLNAVVGAKGLDGYLLVSDEAIEDGRVEYRGANVSSPADMRVLEQVVRQSVLVERLERVGVDPAVVQQAQIPVAMRTVSIREGRVTEESGESAFLLAYGVWMVLYIAILLYGQQVVGSVVEEKTSRIIEVLVSSLRPFQLLAGKIVGVGLVGVAQLLIWGASAWLLFDRRDQVLGLMGVTIPAGQLPIPHIPAVMIVIVVVYFVLGYFLYASMFAAVGAMSNSDAEARQAQMPVIMLLVIPTILMIGIIQEPDSSLALTLSLVPFTSPIAMPVRWAAAPVATNELVFSFALLAFALWFVTWVAARIYRIGILMYGKRPGLGELVRWVRAR
jgi:ABC-2 type transport system permease protein